ncbi:MAG: hypothetical protein HYR60_33460, partial [Acidobacteria bacterium]|nr:hypothetical protein [Acidobacteriota bacterium]
KFMAGLTLFETDTLSVLAQQNAANAPFSFPGGAANNFNTQQNQGGSVFSPDGQTLYSAFNIAPVQNPAARPNVSRLLLNDPDNLLLALGLQLPESLAGKMATTNDGGTVFGLSESGFLILPVNQILQNPIAVPESPVVLLANDQCGVVADKRTAGVPVTNAGRGRLTASAQLLMLPAAPGGLGGFGGPGGGGPGGGVIIIIAPGGGGAGGGAAGFGGFGGPAAGAQAGVAQTSPLVQMQNTPSGTMVSFRFNPLAGRAMGTVAPHNFLIQSNEAINIPANVKVFQNNRDADARGELMPVAVNASDQEGLFDILMDSTRNRLYIANSGMNRVEVFDVRARKFLTPIKVGQLPHSMAFGTDGVTLYVANTGSESISVVDLDRMLQVGRVRFPPLPFNSNVALATPQVIAPTQRGPQVIVSSGANTATLWKIVGNEAIPRTLNPVVFNNARTLPGPTQTMVSTPNGEFTLLLAGNGVAYLYDAAIDEWVPSRQLFANNQPTLAPMSGYYGPVAAGPRGQYYVVNGLVLNQALTPVASTPSLPLPPLPGGLPNRGGPTTTSVPIAAVAAGGTGTFARFSQPVVANANQLNAVSQPPTVEIVDINTGAAMRSVPALEGPLARVVGNQIQRVSGRTMALDAAGTTAYVLTTSGLSVVPLTPVAPADRPLVPANGVVNVASFQPQVAPGTLVSVFGRNLAASATAPSGGNLPTTLGAACVTLNNQPLPLLLTSDSQINAQIPPELAAGRYPLVVRSIDRQAAANPVQITVAKVAPAVFATADGQPALYHADGSPVTQDRPARRDERLTMFAAGLGVTTGGRVTAGAPAPSSPLAVTQKVQVYFGDPRYKQSEVIVDWSGLLPGSVGVYQLNLRVPGFHTSGRALPITLRIGGVTSPSKGPVLPVVAVE